jgi:hypothetical protein
MQQFAWWERCEAKHTAHRSRQATAPFMSKWQWVNQPTHGKAIEFPRQPSPQNRVDEAEHKVSLRRCVSPRIEKRRAVNVE